MEIETYDDKSGLISRLTKLAENGRYIFRGYSHQSQLLPSIVRKKLIDQEAALLFEFERSANQYLNTSNPVDFMSYAQHYGLATRLLDFTYNPFIALYFALFTSKGPNYTVEDDKKYYYRSKISRNYWLFEPKCRNNAEITYTQRLQIASYFP